ncbi:MAG: hypothetical protein ACT4NY_29520 [Pseudonocardiales bacterium]
MAGEVRGLPYPQAQAALEQLFGEPVARLFGPPYGAEAIRRTQHHNGAATGRGTGRTDWEGQAIAMSADRARGFLARIENSNVGTETLDQLVDDLFRLVTAARQQPLPALLDELVDTQDRAFKFLARCQQVKQIRDLYLLTGIASGLMAKVSLDMGAPHDAITQTRAAYACAENAGHDGLRASVRALQSGISYWSGRLDEAIRYIELGTEPAARSRGTIGVWIASSEARSLAALGRFKDARAAIARADELREHVQPDELDSLGLTFGRPRQLYLAADALAWGGRTTASETERLALDALNAYMDSAPEHRAFGMEAGARSALAIARVFQGEIEGAAEALTPVFELPPTKRILGIVASVEHVRNALHTIKGSSREADELAGAIEGFTSLHLAFRK